jgi:hypothetical protein
VEDTELVPAATARQTIRAREWRPIMKGLLSGLFRFGDQREVARVRCKEYNQAEWYLLTGMDSPLGGTWCTRR